MRIKNPKYFKLLVSEVSTINKKHFLDHISDLKLLSKEDNDKNEWHKCVCCSSQVSAAGKIKSGDEIHLFCSYCLMDAYNELYNPSTKQNTKAIPPSDLYNKLVELKEIIESKESTLISSKTNSWLESNLKFLSKTNNNIKNSLKTGNLIDDDDFPKNSLIGNSFLASTSMKNDDCLIALNNKSYYGNLIFKNNFPSSPESYRMALGKNTEISNFSNDFNNGDLVTVTFLTKNHEQDSWTLQRETKPFFWIFSKNLFLKGLNEIIESENDMKFFEQVSSGKIKNNESANWNKFEETFIGQAKAKEHAKTLLAKSEISKKRVELGLPDNQFKLNSLFVGAPGTGKTTLAKNLGKLLKEKGLLSEGDFILATKSDLVGEYVGHTENKVKNLVAKAKGSVLFIDEAYNLIPKGDNNRDFGYNALQTLMEEMDKLNNDIMIIFAGYEDQIERVLNVNEGYRRRFPHVIKFENYSLDELVNIFDFHSKNYNVIVDESQKEKIKKTISSNMNDKNFGNGGYVTNLLEKISLKRDLRLYESKEIESLTENDLTTVLDSDLDIQNDNTYNKPKAKKVISIS